MERFERDIIFDRFGAAQLRLLDTGSFILFDGTHVGYLDGDMVYSYTGNQVGWYDEGILRDEHGYTVGFGVNPRDADQPVLPFTQKLPMRSKPAESLGRPDYQIDLVEKPKDLSKWSPYGPAQLFEGR